MGPAAGAAAAAAAASRPISKNLLRRAQERWRGMLPRAAASPAAVSRCSALGVVVVWLLSGIYSVGADEQGVVLRFGQFVARTGPGINYHLPWPIETRD